MFDFVVLSGAKDPYAPPTFPADLRAGSTAFRVVVLSGAKRSRRTRTPVIAGGNDAACGRQEGRILHFVQNDGEGRKSGFFTSFRMTGKDEGTDFSLHSKGRGLVNGDAQKKPCNFV